MPEKLDSDTSGYFEHLLISNTVQLDAVTQLLIAKGVFSKEEYSEMIARVQMEYQKSAS